MLNIFQATNKCSFPTANVSLSNPLLPGERYAVSLDLELPTSQSNRDAGMFVVCAEVVDQEGRGVMEQPACR